MAAIAGWGLAACVVALTIGLAHTQSRGGLIAAATVGVTAAVLYRRRWRSALLLAVGAVVIVAGTWLVVSPQASSHVFKRNDGGAGRSTLWLVAWRVAEANPVGGAGLDNFRSVAPRYVRQPGTLRYVEKVTDRPHVVHNTYLQLLAETGLVGLGLFLAVVTACLTAAWRAASAFDRLGQSDLALLSRAVLLAGVGVLAALLFISAGTDPRLWLLLALGPALWTIASLTLAQATVTARDPAHATVSVLVPVRNEEPHLHVLIESLRAQQLDESVEFLVPRGRLHGTDPLDPGTSEGAGAAVPHDRHAGRNTPGASTSDFERRAASSSRAWTRTRAIRPATSRRGSPGCVGATWRA